MRQTHLSDLRVGGDPMLFQRFFFLSGAAIESETTLLLDMAKRRRTTSRITTTGWCSKSQASLKTTLRLEIHGAPEAEVEVDIELTQGWRPQA